MQQLTLKMLDFSLGTEIIFKTGNTRFHYVVTGMRDNHPIITFKKCSKVCWIVPDQLKMLEVKHQDAKFKQDHKTCNDTTTTGRYRAHRAYLKRTLQAVSEDDVKMDIRQNSC